MVAWARVTPAGMFCVALTTAPVVVTTGLLTTIPAYAPLRADVRVAPLADKTPAVVAALALPLPMQDIAPEEVAVEQVRHALAPAFGLKVATGQLPQLLYPAVLAVLAL